jgi:hypothetical protein
MLYDMVGVKHHIIISKHYTSTMKSSYRLLAPSVLLCTIESSSAFVPASASRESLIRVHSESSNSSSSSRGGRFNKSAVTSTGGGMMGIESDELAEEYEYNEADFANYVSDYSSDSAAADDDDDDDLDVDEDGIGGGDGSILLSGYDDYSTIGGFDLTPFEKHAREVFLTYALQVQSAIDHDSDDLATSANEDCEETRVENAAILKKDLFGMLQALDIDASLEESEALFKYLDIDDDGRVTLDEVSVSPS